MLHAGFDNTRLHLHHAAIVHTGEDGPLFIQIHNQHGIAGLQRTRQHIPVRAFLMYGVGLVLQLVQASADLRARIN